MSDFYDALKADVGALLEELGRPVTYVRSTYATDLVAGTAVPTIVASDTLATVFVPIGDKHAQALDVRFMDDVQDAREMKLGLVSTVGSTFRPQPKDQAVFGGQTWDVIGCTPIDPAGTPVLFVVGLVLP